MNILTFDIEDWYNCDFISGNLNWSAYEPRIEQGVDRILETLSKRKLKGTFFCLGWLADNHPNVIKRIHSEGHQIGCHSYQHQLATSFTADEFREDTHKAKLALEDVIGERVDAFRAPGFSITQKNKEYLKILVELGFKYDCSIFPAKHDYGGMPSYGKACPKIIQVSNERTIKEFPINTQKILGTDLVFSGGGFFRIMPYWLINYWGAKTNYLMTYFHPRDFDFYQPRMTDLPKLRYFKSYVGLKKSFGKFEKMLDDFDFINLLEADSRIDWSKCVVLDLSNL